MTDPRSASAASVAEMKRLLPEHPPVVAGSVKIGCVDMPAATYGTFREAMVYEAQNPATTRTLHRLVDGPHRTQVVEGRENGTVPTASGGSIVTWNASQMSVDPEGGRRSPATHLGHEIQHADRLTHDRANTMARAHTSDAAYGNLDEKDIITGWEADTTKILGEGTRHTHTEGHHLTARGVTSTEFVSRAKVDGTEVDLKNGFAQDGRITKITSDTVVQSRGRGEIVWPRGELEASGAFHAIAAAARHGESVHIAIGPQGPVATVPQQHLDRSPQHANGAGR